MAELKSSITPHIDKIGRVMVTNGGAHPPEFWAQVTAEQIAPINSGMTGKRLRAAQALQGAIADALEPHHEKVQAEATEINPEPYLESVLDDIQNAAKGTEWESHFTFVKTKPAWLDDHLERVAEIGEPHLDQAVSDGLYEHLAPEQQSEKNRYLRYCFIRFEVGRHFATAQHIALQYKQGAN